MNLFGTMSKEQEQSIYELRIIGGVLELLDDNLTASYFKLLNNNQRKYFREIEKGTSVSRVACKIIIGILESSLAKINDEGRASLSDAIYNKNYDFTSVSWVATTLCLLTWFAMKEKDEADKQKIFDEVYSLITEKMKFLDADAATDYTADGLPEIFNLLKAKTELLSTSSG